ncbi:transmembrane protein, putative [Medicago truncatula]|uniref:Transmembrane protein, putative n=1 Tax=Medicago truncatula TaxID=3880 RepID=A0A072VJN5_MEDTR|nr:transmembrane protein, putative [Medicago truncatula]
MQKYEFACVSLNENDLNITVLVLCLLDFGSLIKKWWLEVDVKLLTCFPGQGVIAIVFPVVMMCSSSSCGYWLSKSSHNPWLKTACKLASK